MGESIMTNWDLGEFCVGGNLPFLLWQLQLPICWLRILMQGLLNKTRQVTPLLSHLRLYPPYRNDFDLSSVHLVLNSTIMVEPKVKLSLSNSQSHDHQLTLRTAYTEYNIHRVQHVPSTPYNEDCISSLHSHNYKLTAPCSFSVPANKIDHHQPAHHDSSTMTSPCHIPTVVS